METQRRHYWWLVTAPNITITSSGLGTGGTYKIGDTVTACWNDTASGDNSPNITGVTMVFSQFGAASLVTATDNSNLWTASYTIVPGSIDARNCNVLVTATSGTGRVPVITETTWRQVGASKKVAQKVVPLFPHDHAAAIRSACPQC